MAIKINIGMIKKVGQPNFGSRGASCNVEFEMDGSFDNGGADRFQEATRKAYAACCHAVESELGCTVEETDSVIGSSRIGGLHSSPPPQNGHGHGNGNKHAYGPSRSGIRIATASQIRAIHAIAKRSPVDLPVLLGRFNVNRPEDLSIADASSLIDQMKGTSGNPGTAVPR